MIEKATPMIKKTALDLSLVVLALVTVACSSSPGSGENDQGLLVLPDRAPPPSAPDRGPDRGADLPAVDAPPAPTGYWSEVSATVAPIGRSVHRLVYDSARGHLLLVGGQPGGQALPAGDLWRWDGSSWTELAPATALPPRKNHGVAYDSARQRVVVFGGIVGGLAAPSKSLDDTWEWNGQDWIDRTAAKKPAARAGHAMTYDPVRGVVLVFGGTYSSAPFNDTWEYNDGVWTERTPATSPPGRFNTQMVFDEARQVVVLFGGQTLTGPLNDTWEWDGKSWVERTPGTSPPGRGFHSLAYDATRKRTVLNGGTTKWPPYIASDNMFDDHWEWDGSSWASQGPVPLGLRAAHAAAFDTGRKRLVLFGGMRAVGTQQGVDSDTWEYLLKGQ
jgi:hypothetical protein